MPGPEARADEGGGEGAGLGREPARLCGYLQKLSGKGPLRGYRSRWFVFDARRCYLYYFKSPQDALPLGHLDIADACFSYQGPDEAAEPGAEPPAHFQVHSAGAVTVLKVGPAAPPAAAAPRRSARGRPPPPSFPLPAPSPDSVPGTPSLGGPLRAPRLLAAPALGAAGPLTLAERLRSCRAAGRPRCAPRRATSRPERRRPGGRDSPAGGAQAGRG